MRSRRSIGTWIRRLGMANVLHFLALFIFMHNISAPYQLALDQTHFTVNFSINILLTFFGLIFLFIDLALNLVVAHMLSKEDRNSPLLRIATLHAVISLPLRFVIIFWVSPIIWTWIALSSAVYAYLLFRYSDHHMTSTYSQELAVLGGLNLSTITIPVVAFLSNSPDSLSLSVISNLMIAIKFFLPLLAAVIFTRWGQQLIDMEKTRRRNEELLYGDPSEMEEKPPQRHLGRRGAIYGAVLLLAIILRSEFSLSALSEFLILTLVPYLAFVLTYGIKTRTERIMDDPGIQLSGVGMAVFFYLFSRFVQGRMEFSSISNNSIISAAGQVLPYILIPLCMSAIAFVFGNYVLVASEIDVRARIRKEYGLDTE